MQIEVKGSQIRKYDVIVASGAIATERSWWSKTSPGTAMITLAHNDKIVYASVGMNELILVDRD